METEELEDPPIQLSGRAEGLVTQDIIQEPVVKEEETGEETESLTLIDARNCFNGLSRIVMLWAARHRWQSGARFALNCYRHEVKIVV